MKISINEAINILNKYNNYITLVDGHELYKEIENAFLHNQYKDEYLICKNIIKKQKMKDGSIIPKSYIFYYNKKSRSKESRVNRKKLGTMSNNYTTDKYIGGVEVFRTSGYESYMLPLLDEGYIIEYERGVYRLHTNLLIKMIEELPIVLNSKGVLEIIKKIKK
jgi:hypothetical protein